MKKQYNLYQLPAYTARAGKADQAFWSKDSVIIFLVLGLSTLDAVTLYTVFDRIMYESWTTSIILTVGCAIALNFIPLVIGRFIHLYRYHMSGVRLWMIFAMLIVFLILFCATFYLRWETREINFTGIESSMVDATGNASSLAATDSDSNEAVAITILLGILPGVTSAINLALGYINDDPVKRKLGKLNMELCRLRQHRNVLVAACEELNQDWKARLDELDEQRYLFACEEERATTNLIEVLARFLLAQRLRDPDSISALTEPKISTNE